GSTCSNELGHQRLQIADRAAQLGYWRSLPFSILPNINESGRLDTVNQTRTGQQGKHHIQARVEQQCHYNKLAAISACQLEYEIRNDAEIINELRSRNGIKPDSKSGTEAGNGSRGVSPAPEQSANESRKKLNQAEGRDGAHATQRHIGLHEIGIQATE